MSVEFYLGLFAAIPIGLLTWFLQRRIEPYLDKRANRTIKGKISTIKREYEKVDNIRKNGELNTFLLQILLYIALVGAIGSIFISLISVSMSAIMATIEFNDRGIGRLSFGIDTDLMRSVGVWFFNILQLLIGLVVAIFTFRKAREGFLVYQRCLNFERFSAETMEKIASLESKT